MAARRWLLVALSLGSLVVLVYAGISFAFSVPVTAEMAAATGAAGEGERAVVVPLADPRTMPTHARDGEGGLLLLGESGSPFPSGATDTSLARALAYYDETPNATSGNDTLVLVDVPGPDGTRANLTVNLTALGIDGPGFVVKADAEENASWAPAARVVGEVVRFERPTQTVMLFVSGSFGFALPLVALVLTHHGAGRKGDAPQPFCRECKAPLSQAEAFCTRCGAWREG